MTAPASFAVLVNLTAPDLDVTRKARETSTRFFQTQGGFVSQSGQRAQTEGFGDLSSGMLRPVPAPTV
ncbi:hypothetical protein [uncultured Roseobacter sp.]|uniref:hypothetical protein n=1 Tax=uncultured Roseobacter sp. TaxID=114847 RepID=UPI00261B2712|nr:hypothetical protein [uncultured Roseobacter sp.]